MKIVILFFRTTFVIFIGIKIINQFILTLVKHITFLNQLK